MITNKNTLITNLTAEVEKQNKENKTVHDPMTKTRARLRNELSQLLDKYDNDMNDWNNRYKELQLQHDKELSELSVLAEHFRKVYNNKYKNRLMKKQKEYLKKKQILE